MNATAMLAAFRRHGVSSVTHAWVLLQLAERERVPFEDVKRSLGIQGGSLTAVRDNLSRKGLAGCEGNGTDRRKLALTPTEAGRALVKAVEMEVAK